MHCTGIIALLKTLIASAVFRCRLLQGNRSSLENSAANEVDTLVSGNTFILVSTLNRELSVLSARSNNLHLLGVPVDKLQNLITQR